MVISFQVKSCTIEWMDDETGDWIRPPPVKSGTHGLTKKNKWTRESGEKGKAPTWSINKQMDQVRRRGKWEGPTWSMLRNSKVSISKPKEPSTMSSTRSATLAAGGVYGKGMLCINAGSVHVQVEVYSGRQAGRWRRRAGRW